MEAEVKEFKKQLSVPGATFTVGYIIYFIWRIMLNKWDEVIAIGIMGVLFIGYLYLIRPYKYKISQKTFTICRRLLKDKEYNLMDVETICDPLPKMTKIITNAHSYEMYITGGKRLVVAPKDQMGFVDAVIHANKRVHCQVKAYNEKYRKVEKKRRRENRREEKLDEAK
ncbi:MAG: hypothetical protein PHH04_02380 [Thomasclavelia sp.]|nr:hypothetical protein [Thomasclavelia sp.]